MKKLLFLLIPCLALFSGCVGGIRSATDQVTDHAATGGTSVRGPKVDLGKTVTITLFTVETKVVKRTEEPVLAAGASAFSKTGIEALNAATRSERGGLKTVGYDLKQLNTDVSTNAAGTVEAIGGAAGKLINKAAGVP